MQQPEGGHGGPYFGAGAATSFWKRESLPATASKLRLRLGNLDKFTAAGLPVFGTVGLSVTAQTLDPAGEAPA
jgi:hypothetical protein